MRSPRSSPVRSSSPSAAFQPSACKRGPTSARTKARNRSPGLAVEQAVAPAEAGHERPPDGDVGLVGEAVGQLAEGGRRPPSRRRPPAQVSSTSAYRSTVDSSRCAAAASRVRSASSYATRKKPWPPLLTTTTASGESRGSRSSSWSSSAFDSCARPAVAEPASVRPGTTWRTPTGMAQRVSPTVAASAPSSSNRKRCWRSTSVEPSASSEAVTSGIALLPDPAVHDAPDRLAGGGLERVPQVGRLGVPVAVLGQVVADAVPEPLLAQVLLQHAQQRAALLVGQDVEHPVGVLRRHDLELDRAGWSSGCRSRRPRCARG